MMLPAHAVDVDDIWHALSRSRIRSGEEQATTVHVFNYSIGISL